ncbi:MAG TPA: hypothetical protein VLY21_05785 [Nitrososphaerales archaeon]|nr:hypothetical protein [Nitrososphaerales archaeon]
MFTKARTSILSLSIISLLVIAAPMTAFAASTNSTVHSATVLPSGHNITPNAAAKFSAAAGISPTKIVKDKGVWGGYGQVDSANNIAGGADGWIVPTTTCDPTNANEQLSALITWTGAYSGYPFYAGLVFECAQGQSGPATIYMGDAYQGFYSGLANAGDEVTTFTAAINSTTEIFYTADWTSGNNVLSYWNAGSVPTSDFNGVVDTFSGCSTATGICPQVNFGTVDDGTFFFTSPSVVCTFNPDGTTPAFPCVGYGAPWNPSSTYFYPIGKAPHTGTITVYKYLMTEGDTSLSRTFTKTGGFAYGDHASHTYLFKHA